MLLDAKMFGRYEVKFPIENKTSIVIGPNGAGKTQLLRMLTEYFTQQGENVLYFSENRFFRVTSDDALKAIMMFKMTQNGNDIFSKIGFNFDLVDFESNYNRLINNGFLQVANFFTQIMLGGDNLIVIIDEPERNLHISVQHVFLESMFSLTNIKKLIVATHSPSILVHYYQHAVEITQCVDLGHKN